MESKELEIIKELMSQLQSEMKPGADDLEERLGRKKPGIEVLKIEGKLPGEGLEKAEDLLGKDVDQDKEMGEPPEHMSMGDDEGEGEGFDFDEEEGMFKPKSSGMDLKKRLLALRGK